MFIFLGVFEKHFEAWNLEEKIFKDEINSLIDARPRKLRKIDGEYNFQIILGRLRENPKISFTLVDMLYGIDDQQRCPTLTWRRPIDGPCWSPSFGTEPWKFEIKLPSQIIHRCPPSTGPRLPP